MRSYRALARGHSAGHWLKTSIVSGGRIDFTRPWTEKTYGIPPEQVVGSSSVTEFRFTADNKPELIKTAKIEFVDDGPGKPVVSGSISDAGQSSHSATPMVISKCSSRWQAERAGVSQSTFTTTTPSVNTLTTAFNDRKIGQGPGGSLRQGLVGDQH